MIPIVTLAEMNAIDRAAPEPVTELIERAGGAVARSAVDLLGGSYGRRVVIVAGKGNNGNDGRAAARRLAQRGVRVTVFDAETAAATLPPADLVIDAAYGTGFRGTYVSPRPADGDTPVLAVDIVSGVSGSTGHAGPGVLGATMTVTFAALKPGLLIGAGRRLSGRIVVADIGLDTAGATSGLVTAHDVAGWVPRRGTESHKWRNAVWLIAGSAGMSGAAHLAARGAQRAGAGYVRSSSPGVRSAATDPVEVVGVSLPVVGWAAEVLAGAERFGAVAVGPGLGVGAEVAAEVALVVTVPRPLVIDGDGLRALGDQPEVVLASRPGGASPVVLTPHEGEFARLGGNLGSSGGGATDGGGDGVDRFEAVRNMAARTGAVVLLKGSTTIVAHPDGRTLVSTSGDARLATAGTGDVLTGIIAALLAGGTAPFEAAAAGAWLHGRAGRAGPPSGLVAGDLPDLVPGVMADLPEGIADRG